MAEKPDYVANFKKPKGTTIKQINGKWYLYERYVEYDPVRKGPHTRSGPIVGRITENGLIPSRHRVRKSDPVEGIETLGSMRACLDPDTEEWVMYPTDGKAEELCRQLGCDPKEFLRGGGGDRKERCCSR